MNNLQEKISGTSRLNDIFEDIRKSLQDHGSKNQNNQSTDIVNEPPASAAVSDADADANAEATSPKTHAGRPDIGRKIQDAIDVLRELEWDEGTSYEAQEAERLLAETQRLFRFLRQSGLEGRLERSMLKSTKRKRTDNDLEEDVLFDRELKKLRAVAFDKKVNINTKGMLPISQIKHGIANLFLGLVPIKFTD